MNAVSLIPGTVALKLHDEHLYVHVLNTDRPDAILADIAALEDRIIAAFGVARRPQTQPT